MRRVLVLLGVLALALVAAGVGLVLVVTRGGVSARAEPSALERRVARAVRHWAIPASARGMPDPMPPSAGAVAEGRAHFADHCATCHGNDGSGRTEMGRNLWPRPPDMRAADTQGLSDGELFYIIENGVRLTGMPGWGVPGHAEDSWELVQFIRHLPRLTGEEVLQMEALNPKSPAEWRQLQAEDAFLRGAAPAPAGQEHSREEGSR